MKKIYLLIISVLVFWMSGCAYEFRYVSLNDIYDFEKEYIIFYVDDCPYCEDVFSYIKEEEIVVYLCNIDDSNIKREYSYSDGQGQEKDYYVDGLTKIDDLYIPKVPCLIEISNHVSYFKASGKKEIIQFLQVT